MSTTWLRSLLAPVGLLLIFFLVPFDADRAPVGVLVGVLVSLLGLGLVSAVVYREAGRRERQFTVVRLVLLLEAVLMTFSFLYYLLASSGPGQFVGLETRLDALYFATTTISTVGYGDVHASGQLARGLVTAQIVFNLGFVAAFATLLRDRLNTIRETPPDEEPDPS